MSRRVLDHYLAILESQAIDLDPSERMTFLRGAVAGVQLMNDAWGVWKDGSQYVGVGQYRVRDVNKEVDLWLEEMEEKHG